MQDMSGQIRGTFNIAGSEAKVKHLPCSQEVTLDSRLTDLSSDVLGEEYRHPHHQLPGVQGGADLESSSPVVRPGEAQVERGPGLHQLLDRHDV